MAMTEDMAAGRCLGMLEAPDQLFELMSGHHVLVNGLVYGPFPSLEAARAGLALQLTRIARRVRRRFIPPVAAV